MNNFNGNSNVNNEEDRDNFFKLTQLIGVNIQKILQNVSAMNKIVMQLNKIQDTSNVKKRLRDLSNYTQQLTKDTSHNLKELLEIRYSSQSEQMHLKIQKERLTEQFKSALKQFEATQCKVYDKENELIKLMKLSESTQMLSPTSSSNHQKEYATFKDISRNGQTQVQIQNTVNSKLIDQAEAVKQIEKNVEDVHHMFKQFNEYIEADREIIIAVDKNVNDTDILIIEGIENVINTTSHMKKYRRKSCYLIVICTVIVLIIIFIFIKN